MNAPNVNVHFEIDTRGGHCQRFVTSLVVLLRPTESVMSESTVRQYLRFFVLIREDYVDRRNFCRSIEHCLGSLKIGLIKPDIYFVFEIIWIEQII